MVLSTTVSADAPAPSSDADQDRVLKEHKAREKTLSLVGSLPMTDKFSVIGRLGAYSWDVDSQGSTTVGATTVNLDGGDSGTDIIYGVGAQYDINKNLGLRAEYEVYKDVGDEGDIDFLSAGIVFRF